MRIVDYRTLGEEYFAHVLSLVMKRIESYDLTISYSGELPVASGADFDGLSIVFTDKMQPEAVLFNVMHIFGHIIQWCTDPEHLILARRVIVPGNPLPELDLLAIKLYEQEASEYSIQMLHDVGVYELDQWISDIWHWDWDYLEGVYVRNAPAEPALSYDYAKIPFGRTWLRPRPIPEFVSRRFGTRTVI